jgi:hypothetical protein
MHIQQIVENRSLGTFDSHDITEILLKVELNTINSNPIHNFFSLLYYREKMTKMKYY